MAPVPRRIVDDEHVDADVTTMRIERPETSLQIVARVVVDDDHREVGLDHPYTPAMPSLSVPCRLCGGPSAHVATYDIRLLKGYWAKVDDGDPPVEIRRCRTYGSYFTSTVPAPALIEAQYMVDWDEYYTDDRSPERKADRCLAQIARFVPSGSRIMDVGGGNGAFSHGRCRAIRQLAAGAAPRSVGTTRGRGSDGPRHGSTRPPRARSMRSRSGTSTSMCGRTTGSSIRSGEPSHRGACS